MNRKWDASPDRPAPLPHYQRALFHLDDGTGRGTVPVRFGWWRWSNGHRTWVLWRPRWARKRR